MKRLRKEKRTLTTEYLPLQRYSERSSVKLTLPKSCSCGRVAD